jgi:predicted nucleic acid-binding protein
VRSFVDTNVLVYADAVDEPIKQRQALDLIRRLLVQGDGVLSTQVLQEFVNVALKKLRLPAVLVQERLSLYRRFEVVSTSVDAITAALTLTAQHSLSFYDALIVHAAQRSGCAALLSEDLQTGAVLGGVRILNPFGLSSAATPATRSRPRRR